MMFIFFPFLFEKIFDEVEPLRPILYRQKNLLVSLTEAMIENKQIVIRRFYHQDTCCQCGEQLQNSGEPGIHLCSGSNNTDVVVEKTSSEVGETSDPKEDDLDERLGEFNITFWNCHQAVVKDYPISSILCFMTESDWVEQICNIHNGMVVHLKQVEAPSPLDRIHNVPVLFL